jgi:BirA family biotin operon repressor/biotin-[acetyl-CoA-carboxylase] ligase
MIPLDLDRICHHVIYRRTVDSTMHVAEPLEIGAVVVAEEQTAGLGRHGHSWHSEAFAGIYCSIVLRPSPVLTLALGLAAADAIAAATGIVCDLRWPNDLMLGGRKVAGILVQMVNGKAVAGIGINVNHTRFPEGLDATSLRLHAGRALAREDILAALLPAVDHYTSLDPESVLRLFAAASSYATGRRVRVDQNGETIEGTTAGLDSSGFLIVRRDDGTDTLVLAGGVRAAGT